MKRDGNIQPFYFDSGGKQLFGCYQFPVSAPARQCGIVLCNPLGHEYIHLHRAYRDLSLRLVRAGFPVLRFDYYGTGDSAGDRTEGSLAQWGHDVSAAIEVIRNKAGVARVCLAGFRIGATLATLLGTIRKDIDGLLLMDPVINGSDYIEELTSLHQDMLQYAHVIERPDVSGKGVREMLGFPYTEALLQELRNSDITAGTERPAHNILLIGTHDRIDQSPLQARLEACGARVERRLIPVPQLWVWVEDLGRILVPVPVMQAAVTWLSGVYP